MLIKVKAFPGSKKEEVIEKSENFFEIKVKEKPIMGQANRAIINVLSCHFNVPKENVRLVRGFKERNKVFNIIL
jgi:hypothetical protein